MNKIGRHSSPVRQSWFERHPYLIIFLVCFLLYVQILSFGLVQFDDHGFVLMAKDNLLLSNIPEFFRHSVFWVLGDTTQETDVFYRPLQNVIYAICNTIASEQPWIYHLFGLGFHAFASCLLLHFFMGLNFHYSVSFLFTLIYAVHPVLVQGVAWIAGIGDQLATIFILSSAIYFFRFVSDRRKSIKHFLIHLAMYVCALFSKEITIMFILVCLFWYFFLARRENGKIVFVSFIIWIGIAAFYFFLRNEAIYSSGTNLVVSAFESFKINGLLVLEYFEKIFFPYRLSPIPSREDAQYLIGGIILSIFVTLFIIRKRFTRTSLFGALWFVLFLFPSFIQQNPQAHFFAFEHRLYLPLIGILIMMIELLNVKEIKFHSQVQKYSFLVLLLILSGISFLHCRTFKDPHTFYDKALTSSPRSVIAYNGYGKFLLQEEKYAEAVEAFKNSYKYKSDDMQTTGKIAEIYMKNLQNPHEAIVWFKKTLDIAPNSIEATVSIGDVYWNLLRDTVNAVLWYEKALKIDPKNEFALANLGMIYASMGEKEKARNFLSQSLESNSKNLVALKWMAIILFNDGKVSEAVYFLNKAYQNYPNDTDLIRNLMICYYRLNDFRNTKKFAELVSRVNAPIPDEISNYLTQKQN